jgi:hypothetical protein
MATPTATKVILFVEDAQVDYLDGEGLRPLDQPAVSGVHPIEGTDGDHGAARRIIEREVRVVQELDLHSPPILPQRD